MKNYLKKLAANIFRRREGGWGVKGSKVLSSKKYSKKCSKKYLTGKVLKKVVLKVLKKVLKGQFCSKKYF